MRVCKYNSLFLRNFSFRLPHSRFFYHIRVCKRIGIFLIITFYLETSRFIYHILVLEYRVILIFFKYNPLFLSSFSHTKHLKSPTSQFSLYHHMYTYISLDILLSYSSVSSRILVAISFDISSSPAVPFIIHNSSPFLEYPSNLCF